MHRDPPTNHRDFAKTMRLQPTEAEKRLWQILRAHRLGGLKFKRQVPIEGYIVDFVCFEARLIVEADGGQHADSRADIARDQRLSALGFRILRVWNNDVLANPDGVAAAILGACGGGSAASPSLAISKT
jgi:very-short-patch-repair endonuclease